MKIPSSKPEIFLNKAGLREVLIRQYALHEARHWPLIAAKETRPQAVVPQVHALADIYKCLHQGEFGVGHSISSPGMFRELLSRELHRAGEATSEPLLENVAPDASVFRVNIRPYRLLFQQEVERACELLVEVCLASSRIGQGSTERFLDALAEFKNLNDSGELAWEGRTFIFPPNLVEHFLLQVQDFLTRTGSIPVLSHSSVYRRLNAPSYRVVNWEVLRQSPLASLLTMH